MPAEPAGSARPGIAAARRLVVKVGSSSLTTAGGAIDADRIALLAASCAQRIQAGTDLILVSSGAIATGIAPLGLPSRPRDLATQQAAASVGQGLLIARYTAAFATYAKAIAARLGLTPDIARAVTLAAGLLPVPVPVVPYLGSPRRARLIAAFKSRSMGTHPSRQR